jgi:hypothetical protein
MTVSELRRWLNQLPANDEILIADYEEGVTHGCIVLPHPEIGLPDEDMVKGMEPGPFVIHTAATA